MEKSKAGKEVEWGAVHTCGQCRLLSCPKPPSLSGQHTLNLQSCAHAGSRDNALQSRSLECAYCDIPLGTWSFCLFFILKLLLSRHPSESQQGT